MTGGPAGTIPAGPREPVAPVGPADRPTVPRRGVATLVWSVGLLGYLLAVMQRTTFGVAGLEAADRFAVPPSVLAAFVFVQVTVYVCAQLPGGLLADRWGARTVLVAGGLVLAAGQALLAVATTLPLAVLARVIVGAGDAVMIVAVLALVPRWFPARRVPLYTQLSGILGQLGQILSAVPFLALLQAAGWTPAFLAAAAASLLAAALTAAVVRSAPPGHPPAPAAAGPAGILRELRVIWSRPGTRLGFFAHMAAQFSMMVFTLLWGLPYLVSAQGLAPSTAGALLTVFVVCSIAVGPVVGVLTARLPLRRSFLVLGVAAADVLVWTAVLALPGPAPLWLLVVLVVVLSAGGPGSMVGFDIARTSNPATALGTAQAVVNTGGFLATLVVLAAMGVVMDALGGFTFEAFRIAWLVQYPVWLIAALAVLHYRRRARALDAALGTTPVPLR